MRTYIFNENLYSHDYEFLTEHFNTCLNKCIQSYIRWITFTFIFVSCFVLAFIIIKVVKTDCSLILQSWCWYVFQLFQSSKVRLHRQKPPKMMFWNWSNLLLMKQNELSIKPPKSIHKLKQVPRSSLNPSYDRQQEGSVYQLRKLKLIIDIDVSISPQNNKRRLINVWLPSSLLSGLK